MCLRACVCGFNEGIAHHYYYYTQNGSRKNLKSITKHHYVPKVSVHMIV